jgi:hypothetical protein
MTLPFSVQAPLTDLATDAWSSMPEATLPRWETMQRLVTHLADPHVSRMAVLGYPNPRAVMRVVAGCPTMRSVALVSPVPEFADRTKAMAGRMQCATTVLSLQRSLWSSGLRARHFPVVLLRLPIDATGTRLGVYATLTAHLLEMQRISTATALLVVHLSVRVGPSGDPEGAARLANRTTHMLQGLGARQASLASSLVGPTRSTIDVIGWARLGDAP